MSDIMMPKIKNKQKRAEVYKQFRKEKRKVSKKYGLLSLKETIQYYHPCNVIED